MTELEERRWGKGAVDITAKTLPALKAKRVLKALEGIPTGSRVLDYGCGEGKLLHTVAHHRPDLLLFGLDIQAPAEVSQHFKFELINGDDCPCFHQKFDAILSLDVLEHVVDLEKTLAQMKSMLNQGGKLILFVPMEGERFSPFEFYKMVLGKDLYVQTKSHIQAYRRKEFLKSVGKFFEINDMSYSYHVFGTLLDSTFFAMTRLKSLATWFWKKNSIYHPENKNEGALNWMMEKANFLCFMESEIFKNTSLFSSGLHITATNAGSTRKSVS